MLKEKALEWATALRDGTRKQINGKLRSVDGYCCLGVACEVAEIVPIFNPDFNVYEYYYEGYKLPTVIKDDWEMYSRLGRRNDRQMIDINGKKYDDLSRANDDGVTFLEIANYIEQNWEYL